MLSINIYILVYNFILVLITNIKIYFKFSLIFDLKKLFTHKLLETQDHDANFKK